MMKYMNKKVAYIKNTENMEYTYITPNHIITTHKKIENKTKI